MPPIFVESLMKFFLKLLYNHYIIFRKKMVRVSFLQSPTAVGSHAVLFLGLPLQNGVPGVPKNPKNILGLLRNCVLERCSGMRRSRTAAAEPATNAALQRITMQQTRVHGSTASHPDGTDAAELRTYIGMECRCTKSDGMECRDTKSAAAACNTVVPRPTG